MDGKDNVVVCCIGDGSTEAGVFWESLNFAALHRLRIAYIVENNRLSVDAKIEERQATPLVPRAKAFGMACVENAGAAIVVARQKMPVFCECHVKLECDHLNLAAMLPSLGLS
jgi:pyruvate dehydrogenase E1 component alpha subunit